DTTCLIFNTIGPDREATMREMLGHLGGCTFHDAAGDELTADEVEKRLDAFRLPVRKKYAGKDGWRRADLRENPGDFHTFFVRIAPEVLARYGRALLASDRWLQRETKYRDVPEKQLTAALDDPRAIAAADEAARER